MRARNQTAAPRKVHDRCKMAASCVKAVAPGWSGRADHFLTHRVSGSSPCGARVSDGRFAPSNYLEICIGRYTKTAACLAVVFCPKGSCRQAIRFTQLGRSRSLVTGFSEVQGIKSCLTVHAVLSCKSVHRCCVSARWPIAIPTPRNW